MNRRRLWWSTPVLLALLAGCAQEAAPADPDDLAAAASGWGIPPDVVLTTAVDGFEPAPGGAGAYGSDGFSVVLTNPSDGRIMVLAATRDTMTAQSCPTTPFASTSGAAEGQAECTAEDGMFYRTADGASEYAVQRDDVLVQVSGDGVEREVLREAAEQVRVPSAKILRAMEPPEPMEGVERGDLPPGDGAPDNSVGAGG
ncbi:hypothetical protein [Isoptericola sp. BMS4]|uniref:hypothetical protein n=1 Tax=Isoptericola sp. BMS4 TaxID=2527875 RepID=UPI001423A136|nr:hypothetical protein [Isoptericola sp. BMS4]